MPTEDLAGDLLSRQSISSSLDFNKLGISGGSQIFFNASLYGCCKKLWIQIPDKIFETNSSFYVK